MKAIPVIHNNEYFLFPREAAEDAGFDVLRVISQPAAAALAYGKVTDKIGRLNF